MQPDEQLVSPYENVLITANGSAGAIQVAQHDLTLAESLGTTVYVLFVVDDVSLSPDIRSTTLRQEHKQVATEAAKEIIGDAEAYGVTDVVQHIRQGDPVDVVLNCVDANDIHVVVMETTGRHGTDRVLLGSVAEKTIRSAPVPMLAIGGVE